VVLGSDAATSLGSRRAPIFDFPERVVSALGKAARYSAWRREPLGGQPHLSGVETMGARRAVAAALKQGGGWQPQSRIADILGRYGIPVVPTAAASAAGYRQLAHQ
jgi:acyl-CoA synthetase (NDP forming)